VTTIVRPSADKVGEVARAFLLLGLTSFGGPIAHLAYFRREFVERRHWISDADYAQLMALCQLLPGPTSSQVGFSLGLMRAGWLGALAAFACFTLPSAVLMVLFALARPWISGQIGAAVLHGLAIVALVIVAHGLVAMTRQLCPDLPRILIGIAGAAVALLFSHAAEQFIIVAMGAVAGHAICRNVRPVDGQPFLVRYGHGLAGLCLSAFVLLLALLPVVAVWGDGSVAVVAAFYRAGALVFGGGHVVLPLLQDAVVSPGWIGPEEFLASYGFAQALPGPLFSIAAYLGASIAAPGGGILGAATALVAIFLPGFLLVAAALPMWGTMLRRAGTVRAIAGINAAVVGLLAAALVDPLWTTAVHGPGDALIALVGFVLLTLVRVSPLLVTLWCVCASIVGAML
jgi:chromate transporter